MKISCAFKKNPVILASVSGLLILCALTSLVLALPVLTSVLFLLFCCCTALCGCAVIRLLHLNLSPLEAFACALGLGAGTVIIIYFSLALFGLVYLAPYALGLLCVVGASFLYAKRKLPFTSAGDHGELYTVLSFCGLAALLVLFSVSAANLDPSVSGTRAYLSDTAFASSILSSAARGYPFSLLQLSGYGLSYHAFYYAFGAVAMHFCGTNAFVAVSQLLPLFGAVFIVSGISLFARSAVKSRFYFVAALTAAALLPAGYQMFFYNFCDSLGYPFGLTFAMLFLHFVLKGEKRDGVFTREHAAALIFMLLSLGSKGPVAVTFMFGYGSVLLFRLVGKKDWHVIWRGLIFAVSFFLLYFLIYPPGSGDSMSLSLCYSAVRTPYGYWLANVLPAFLATPISGIIYSLTAFPVITLCAVLSCVFFVSDKEREHERVFLLFAAVFGFVMIDIFKQMGSSERYFLACVFPAAAAALVGFAEKLSEKLANPRRPVQAPLFSAGLLILLAFAGVSFSFEHLFGGLEDAALYSRLSDGKGEALTGYAYDDANMVTPEEYEAYIYLRDNSPPDSVIADSHYIYKGNYFYGTAFSERAFYLEGAMYFLYDTDKYDEFVRRDGILQFFYADRDETFIPLMRDEGIDYIIISELTTPGFVMSDEYADMVYRNDGASIYKIKEA